MWIDDYVKLVFGEGHNLQTMTTGADLKNQNMPDLLFKYRSINEQNLDALQNDYLYSSPPECLNDPFEGAIGLLPSKIKENWYKKLYKDLRAEYPFLPDNLTTCQHDLIDNMAIGFGGSYNDLAENCPDFYLIKLLNDESDKKLDELIEFQQKYARNMYNVCCFSADFDNQRMWALYADSHKGFCTGYDIKGLNNDITHLTLPVLYKQDFYNITDLDDLDGSNSMYALTVKSPEWSYENEWRTFFPCNTPGNKEIMPVPKVLYLGVRVTEPDKNKLKEICKRKGIILYQMNLVPEKQVLKAVKISN